MAPDSPGERSIYLREDGGSDDDAFPCFQDCGGLMSSVTELTQPSFREAISLFMDACPGPPLAKTGLRAAAFQPVEGIPGLEPPNVADEVPKLHLPGRRNGGDTRLGESQEYLRSVKCVARRVKCSPAYLSKAALRHGYSYSRALRWIRLLHAVALLREGLRLDATVWRLGFDDVAGWSRSTMRLVGRKPSQFPSVPLAFWVRKAVDDVYFGVPVAGFPTDGEEKGRQDK